MSDSSPPIVYQLKIVLQGISPVIWRRLLVKSDSTIEDLHYTLQIAMGWEEIHLHYFTIHGKQNHKCRKCGRQFVQNPQNKVISKATKTLIDKLLLEKIPLAPNC